MWSWPLETATSQQSWIHEEKIANCHLPQFPNIAPIDREKTIPSTQKAGPISLSRTPDHRWLFKSVSGFKLTIRLRNIQKHSNAHHLLKTLKSNVACHLQCNVVFNQFSSLFLPKNNKLIMCKIFIWTQWNNSNATETVFLKGCVTVQYFLQWIQLFQLNRLGKQWWMNKSNELAYQ